MVEGRHLWARGPQRAATIASKGRTPLLSTAGSRAATYAPEGRMRPAGRHFCITGLGLGAHWFTLAQLLKSFCVLVTDFNGNKLKCYWGLVEMPHY